MSATPRICNPQNNVFCDVCCLLVLDSVTSTLQWIHQPKPCDVVQDHYEYLIWCEKQGFVKFTKEVEILICETASFEKWEPPKTELEETDIYLKSKMPGSYVFDDSWDDDIPF